MNHPIETVSAITCPECGMDAEERMPETSCQIHYRCRRCGTTLQPKPGNCCIFCSYGSVPCPPVQREGGRSTDGEPTM